MKKQKYYQIVDGRITTSTMATSVIEADFNFKHENEAMWRASEDTISALEYESTSEDDCEWEGGWSLNEGWQ